MRRNAAIIMAIAMSTAACDGETTYGSVSSKVVFSGTISGNAFVNVTPPTTGFQVPLFIVNMKVELRKKDGGSDTVVGTAVTGEGGRFDIPYTTDDSNSSIELYLRFVAETGDGMIRVRKKLALDKKTREQDVLKDTPLVVQSTSPAFSSDQGNIELDGSELKPQLLHWANRARQFVIAELGSASPLPTNPNTPLDILTPPLFAGAQTFFVPATSIDEIVSLASTGLIPLSPPLGVTMLAYVETQFSDQDGLYISRNSEQDDGTTMHEFGHYLMWHAQGKKWLNPLEASFAVHFSFTNSANSKIAWTEGFADGFARIVDNWSFTDDREADSDTASPIVETPGLFGVPTCGGGAGITCNSQATSHGFFSEQYIDHVIYDLWDGPTALTSGPNAASLTGLVYSDGGVDDVERTFTEIMQPILDTMSGTQDSLIDNIVDYHTRLFPTIDDRAIKDLFVAGKMRNLQTSAGTIPELQDIPNTDSISFERDVEVERYKVSNTGTLVKSTGPQIERFTVDVPGFFSSNDDFNIGVTTGSELRLSDDLLVVRNATLTVNSILQRIGWQSAGNRYGAPAGVDFSVPFTLDVTIAPGTHVTAKDNGAIVLGETNTGKMATVTVESGATFELGGGAGGPNPRPDLLTGEMVSKGKLFIHQGSKLIIERGAKLVINKGAEIALDGLGAELIIRGDLEVRSGATFWWTASGGALVTFDLENANGAPNVNLASNAQILVDEVEFAIADKTYIRLPEGIPSKLTIRNGARGHFGEEAYINGSRAMVTLTDSTIDALGTAPHDGIVLNGGPHTIDGMTFKGGKRCLRETQGGVPLTVTSSELINCTTGIDVLATSVALTDVTIKGGTTGLATRGSSQVGIVDSLIKGTAIGWRLTDRGTGGQGISNTDITGALQTGVLIEGTNPTSAPPVSFSDSTVSGSVIGIRSVGNLVRILRSEIQGNGVGVQMESGAVLDLSTSASAQFSGNTTSIKLIGAGKPKLNGSNLFYPKTTTTNGQTLSGTINDSTPCTMPHTITTTTDVWEVWNIGIANWVAQPLPMSTYSLTSTLGCTYTLL